MRMNNRTVFQDTNEFGKISVILPLIICLVFLVSYVSVIIFVYKKNKHDMKPAHVHQINYFLAFCFPISSILVTYLIDWILICGRSVQKTIFDCSP